MIRQLHGDFLKTRILGMESLENRELLSVNPLGYAVEYNADSTDRSFATESVTTEATSELTVISAEVGIIEIAVSAGDSAPPDTVFYLWVKFPGGEWLKTDVAVDSDSEGKVYAQDLAYADERFADELNTVYSFRLATDNAGVLGTQYGNQLDVRISPTGLGGEVLTDSKAAISSVTSNAATISWTKPTMFFGPEGEAAVKSATNYTLTLLGGDEGPITIKLGSKTTWTASGLDDGASYLYSVGPVDRQRRFLSGRSDRDGR